MIQPLLQTAAAPRSLSIFGATGSVGCNTLDLVRRSPGAYRIEALTAYRNLDRLVAQALEFRPEIAVIGDETHYAAR